MGRLERDVPRMLMIFGPRRRWYRARNALQAMQQLQLSSRLEFSMVENQLDTERQSFKRLNHVVDSHQQRGQPQM